MKNSPKNPKNEKTINNNNNSNDILNEEDSLDSEYFENPNNDLLKFSDEEEGNDYQENSSILLENIISVLEKLFNNFKKNDQKLLFNILKEINTVINLLINEFISNSKKKFDNKDNYINNLFITEDKNIYNDENMTNINLDTNSKVVFLVKIETLNRKINSLNEEIKNLKTLLFNSNNNELNKNQNNYYKFLMKKFKEIKDKKKCDEFKYLMYIENQKKKIMDLEAKLNIKNNENLSKDTLKSIRCFPNFVQYNFKEDINPKTIPLSQFFQIEKEKVNKNKTIKKSPKSKRQIINCLSVENKNKNKKQIQHLYNTINSNSSRKVKNKYKTKEITINDKIITDENHYNNKNNNIITIKDLKNNFILFGDKIKYNSNKSNKFSNLLNFYNLDVDNNNKNILKYKTLNQDEQNIIEIRKKIYGINNDIAKEVKDFNPKTIINNKKEFFIAHPTLDIAGVAKGKEQIYIGLPKKLLRLNKGGNFKSTMMVFPSSLNETMVNLEKLRSNKLHVDINKKEN